MTNPSDLNAVEQPEVGTPTPDDQPTPNPAPSTANLAFHPLADLFPQVTGEAYEKIKADIAAFGQQEEIWVYEDQILDGRTRARACDELGITPRIKEWTGPGTPLEFVVSKNLHRRHLTDGQRAMIGAQLLPPLQAAAKERMLAGRTPDPGANLPEGRARDQAAAIVNVSSRTIEAASKVRQDGSEELQEAVKSAQVSVTAAAELTALPKDQQNEVVARGKGAAQQAAKELRKKKPRGRKSAEGEPTRERDANPREVASPDSADTITPASPDTTSAVTASKAQPTLTELDNIIVRSSSMVEWFADLANQTSFRALPRKQKRLYVEKVHKLSIYLNGVFSALKSLAEDGRDTSCP